MMYSQMLQEGAASLGVTLSLDTAEGLLRHMDFLLEWNQKINLTAVEEPHDIVVKHYLDSLTLCALLPHGASLIDVGTGAGFPGIPVKAVRRDIRLTLLDSLAKRVNFLTESCGLLGLQDVACVHGRAEDFGAKAGFREAFDFAAARAVAGLNVLCEYCLPFVAVGGRFLAMKGPDVTQELDGAAKAIALLGGQVVDVQRVSLPFSDITHTVVVIEKTKKCPTKFPRKAGKPSKEPIK